MNITAIKMQHKRVCNLIIRHKVKQSLDVINDMLDNVSFGGFRDEYEDLRMTYHNMLKYTVDGIKDPDRQAIYLKLLQRILRLNDKIKQDILTHHSGWYTYSVRRMEEREEKLGGGTIIQSIDDLVFKSQLDELLSSAEIRSTELLQDDKDKRDRLTEKIFNHLWLTDYYGEAEDSLIDLISSSGKFKWYEQALFVSAVTLSSLRVWDSVKISMLARLYSTDIQHVPERALTGLILNLYYYDDRLGLYPEVMNMIRELSADKRFKEHCRIVVLQAIRSRETEKISRKMQDEILPKVAKMKPQIEEKLDLDTILGENVEEGGNPDWSDMFQDSEEIFHTMEELANMQMDGSDVYMSAFAGLKNFEFFNELRNWFVPFHPDHEAVDVVFHDEILGPGINELAEALYKTPFICNSDKFSLILNMKQLPAEQKNLMLKAFRMELDGLEEMKYDKELTDPVARFRTTVTQYFHDLYRFYKLSNFRDEFDDLFTSRLDLYNSLFFRSTCGSEETDRSLADYFFSKEYYDDALNLYLRIASQGKEDAEVYEKAGYCYQQSGNYEEAIKSYTHASLIDARTWTLRKIGLCQRRMGRVDEALKYYTRALKNEPDDLHTILMTAHCQLDLGEYEDALKNYFRIEYESPGNKRVLRPIAWCYFASGKLNEAKKYYDSLAATDLSSHDRINIGHLYLCQGKTHKATDFYLDAMNSGDLTSEKFISIFNDDSSMLIKNGVSSDDLPIILDYVLMNRDS